ncbi:hypothetical protein H5410_040908 [Solanum commersonii]|uniref:Uncharacterized protein n=1 Tax=Solanum commersonii TaxID=4109 RepID=A0A9J5XRH9_SOLCO|nr:hypothetical protein H5410_040908 [Solanum commersonii]
MLKEMKAHLSSLNKKVNSHSDSIKQLECQMSQFIAQLEYKSNKSFPNDMMVNSKINHDKCFVVLTRSRKPLGVRTEMIPLMLRSPTKNQKMTYPRRLMKLQEN